MNLHHSLTVQAESYKGQIAQLEKELVRLIAVLQQDELKINEWLTLQRKRMPSWNNCFPKTKTGYWLKTSIECIEREGNRFQAVLSERRQKRRNISKLP